MPFRAILDTNVFLGALWSTRGAAFEVFAELRRGRWQMVLSNHLLLEYEEVGKRHAAAEQRQQEPGMDSVVERSGR